MSLRVSTLACLFALGGGLAAWPAAASPGKAGAQPATAETSAVAIDVPQLYAQHCAACHAPNRLGAMGPALLPDNLGRLRKTEAVKVIAEGRTASSVADSPESTTMRSRPFRLAAYRQVSARTRHSSGLSPRRMVATPIEMVSWPTPSPKNV